MPEVLHDCFIPETRAIRPRRNTKKILITELQRGNNGFSRDDLTLFCNGFFVLAIAEGCFTPVVELVQRGDPTVTPRRMHPVGGELSQAPFTRITTS